MEPGGNKVLLNLKSLLVVFNSLLIKSIDMLFGFLFFFIAAILHEFQLRRLSIFIFGHPLVSQTFGVENFDNLIASWSLVFLDPHSCIVTFNSFVKFFLAFPVQINIPQVKVNRWVLFVDRNSIFKILFGFFKLIEMEIRQPSVVVMDRGWLKLYSLFIVSQRIVKFSILEIRQAQVVVS